MMYRRLGRTGLRVSGLSYGTWLTFAEQGDLARAIECLDVARSGGINFFDTADAYGRGRAEELLGMALEQLAWDRATYVLSTKVYCGVRNCVNMQQTLNRKYLLHAIDEALDRLRTPFVDLLYCHRFDPHTPLEEIVWALSDIVGSGKAHYWGTSEWPTEQIRSACEIAERYHLRKPVAEQIEYNLLERVKLEQRYTPLHAELGLGLVTWSPLASGVLTGKYRHGIPTGSRGALRNYAWLTRSLSDPQRIRRAEQLADIARGIGCTPAQLAIAWCVKHSSVSSVVMGASNGRQLRENLGAVDVHDLLSEETCFRLTSGCSNAAN
jgi:voltage-dependent potassium channel beta subunit